MSNKQTVETYLDGFRESNHAKVIALVADDVVWEMP